MRQRKTGKKGREEEKMERISGRWGRGGGGCSVVYHREEGLGEENERGNNEF